ncbi:MAG: glycosyltransferase [Litorilinea sp.]
MNFGRWRRKLARASRVQAWKDRLNPWVRPMLNLVSPYHKAFTQKYPAHLPPSPPVVVVGNILCGNGIGEAGRGTLRALRAANYTAAYVDMPCHQPIPDHEIPEVTPLPGGPRVNLIHMNAKDSRYAYRKLGRQFYRGNLNIGYWFWEQSHFPQEWYPAFGAYKEIWVASRFCQSALAAISPIPVVWMRPHVAPAPPPLYTRTQLGLPEDRFIFYFSFDVMSVLERKNPFGLIEAYRRAFGTNSKTTSLVLKLTGIPQAMKEHKLLGLDPKTLPALDARLAEVGGVMFNQYVPRAYANALLNACDCYVSLHRAEGFGLSIAEAMYYGKPTIATAYSAPVDFMTPGNSYGVGYKVVELEQDHSTFYRAGTEWADPDLDQAAAAMQRVVADPTAAQAVGAQAALDIRRDYGAAPVAAAMMARMRLALFQQR